MSTYEVPPHNVGTFLIEEDAIPNNELYALSALVKKLGPWSVSKAKMAAKCPLQFNWHYVDKRPTDKDIETQDLSVRMGSTMHLLYENLLSGDSKKEAYVKAVTNTKLTTEEQRSMKPMVDGVKWFSETIEEFLKEKRAMEGPILIPELLRDGHVGVERKFALKECLSTPSNFFDNDSLLRGVIDMIIHTKDNGALVLDHKSASFANLKFFKTQLSVYALATLVQYPELEWVQCGVHYMTLKQIQLAPVVHRKDIESLRRGVFYFLSTAANEALSRQIRVGNHCKWCAYRESCKDLRKIIRKSDTSSSQ
jgi:RecB family exonuclease